MSNPINNPATIYATGAVSRNPATDELIATYPYQTPAEVEATLSANAAAFLLWRDTPMAERVAAYQRLAGTLRDRLETLASLITAEMGKTIGAARAEVEKSARRSSGSPSTARASSPTSRCPSMVTIRCTSPIYRSARSSVSCPGTCRSGR